MRLVLNFKINLLDVDVNLNAGILPAKGEITPNDVKSHAKYTNSHAK